MKTEDAATWSKKNKVIDKSAILNFDLSRYLIQLMWKEPFYARILRSMTKIESDSIPTAGVSCEDLEIKLYWNRSFLSSLSNLEVLGVMKHECLHVVYDHIVARIKEPHIIWNYAADLAINCLIPENELPKGGLIPGVRLPALDDDESDKKKSAYNKIADVIEALPKYKSAEFYFDVLNKDEDFTQAVNECNQTHKIAFDDHSGWDDSDESMSEIIKGKIEEIIKDAVKESNDSSWGSVPAALRQSLLKRYSKEIAWQDILKMFCGYSILGDRVSSIKKLSRKYPGIHSGFKKDYKPNIAVYIDESGSMSNEVLSLLYSELESLSKRTTFILYRFDSFVDDKSKIVWKKNKKMSLHRTSCGGTCFNRVTKHALKIKKEINGYIIMTDGYAPKPKPSVGLKRAWLITPNGDLAFEKDRADVIIKMNKNIK